MKGKEVNLPWFSGTNDRGRPHELPGTRGKRRGTHKASKERGVRRRDHLWSRQKNVYPQSAIIGEKKKRPWALKGKEMGLGKSPHERKKLFPLNAVRPLERGSQTTPGQRVRSVREKKFPIP